jgi:Xaa-Pro aminopeptidase
VDYVAQRRDRLAELLRAEEIDALLISNPVNVSYLTGFSGESSYLLLGRQRTLLISDSRFTRQLAEECPGLEAHIRPTSQTLYQATAEVVGKVGPRAVGFESTHLTVADAETLRELIPAVTWKAGRDRVEKLRVIKDASEVAQLREAVAIAERAYAAFRALLQPSDSEKALSDALEAYVRRFGATCTSFPSIVAAGPRAALPHAPPTERAIGDAELLLVDWGASGRFYKSDLTRVLLPRKNRAFARPNGSTRSNLETIYATVLRAQQEAIRAIRPGVRGAEIDAVARRVIAEAGYGECFGHGLGHGLGMQVHEAPSLRPNSETVLQPGMVVTVEPGIYVPDWGGVRIEDDILVTPDGQEVLSNLARDFDSALCLL